MTVAQCAAGFSTIFTAIQFASTAVAALRCPERKVPLPPPKDAHGVTLVRPVCGLDNYAEETLGSSFHLDYPCYEILFCAARADDPILPLIQRLIRDNPRVPSRLLIGDDWINRNPKLNNVAKGWHAARYDWLVMADSNVLMPKDYLQRLLQAWKPDTGLVCSTPIGSRPEGFWAEVECGFLNTHQARWQFAAEAIGLGFAQGKTMLWYRPLLDAAGGIEALGAELAEDAAATKIVRGQGKRVRLVDSPFEQPLGRRRLSEIWSRQLRWARLRRVTFPLFFVPEVLTGSMFSVLAGAYAAWSVGLSPVATGAAILAFWMAMEAVLARRAGWRMRWWSPLAWATRDLLLPLLFVNAWLADDFVWRGNAMDVSESKQT